MDSNLKVPNNLECAQEGLVEEVAKNGEQEGRKRFGLGGKLVMAF